MMMMMMMMQPASSWTSWNHNADICNSKHNRRRARRRSQPRSSATSQFTIKQIYASNTDDNDITIATTDDDDDDGHEDYDDDSQARSQFGTKDYWDELYQGRGDFPADEYQWYYGWDEISSIVRQYVAAGGGGSAGTGANAAGVDVLVLGIGNDPILLDLLQAGYTKLTATDYSEHALERQQDLLDFGGYGDCVVIDDDDDDSGGNGDSRGDESENGHSITSVNLRQMDARRMDPTWSDRFDLVLEKGCLDAVYLSGDGNIERVERELLRTLKPQSGVLVSVSGVVPDDVRRAVFRIERWTWLRDGTDDLKAGCFVLTPK
jgi:hypothetical protein